MRKLLVVYTHFCETFLGTRKQAKVTNIYVHILSRGSKKKELPKKELAIKYRLDIHTKQYYFSKLGKLTPLFYKDMSRDFFSW